MLIRFLAALLHPITADHGPALRANGEIEIEKGIRRS